MKSEEFVICFFFSFRNSSLKSIMQLFVECEESQVLSQEVFIYFLPILILLAQ